MVRLVSAPVRVVETDQVKISEYFGGASCNPCPFPVGDISVAHVQVEAGWAEEWQTPAFDEYALVLQGSVTIETTRGPSTKVSAGQAVFLAKGERVRWHFTERAEYVPICMPAFSPDNCFREDAEAADASPAHDSHESIYHLVQKPLWEACKARGKTYYPPTYAEDGFTHATADASKLLDVANHFYKSVQAEWLCLRMTRETVASAGITLKFEDPSAVGGTPALNTTQSGGARFPHLYGGIPPHIVIEERAVRRAADGTYLSIAGLVERQEQQGQQGQQGPPPTAPLYNVGRIRGVLVAAAAAVCVLGLTRAAALRR